MASLVIGSPGVQRYAALRGGLILTIPADGVLNISCPSAAERADLPLATETDIRHGGTVRTAR